MGHRLYQLCDPNVQITIMDLPGQLNVARTKIAELGLSEPGFICSRKYAR